MAHTLGTVLVTGGAGFIGTAVANRLAADADRWVVVDNLHAQVHPTNSRPRALHPRAELVVRDVTDATAWDALLDDVRPDTVLHLAAETGTAQSLHEATRHAVVNVVGTTAMLDALGRAEHVPRHFVLTSSRAVYGEGEWVREDGERYSPGPRSHAQLASGAWDFPGSGPVPSSASSTPPAPTNVYGATKLAQEHILRAWAASHDTTVTALRLQNVYGPGQSLTNSYTGIVSLFSRLARSGESIPLYEDGEVSRDFVYIDDVASAIAGVMVTKPKAAFSTFDIGSGVGTTLLELAAVIAAFHRAPNPRVTGEFRDGDIRHARCRIEAAAETLAWTPRWSLESGVAALQAWIESESMDA